MSSLPTTFWVGFAAAVLVTLALLAYVFVVDARRRALRMIEEFLRMFPGKCPLCAYHRHASREGITFPLGPHVCIEGNGAPRKSWTRLE